MKLISLLPADTYTIVNKTIITEEDKKNMYKEMNENGDVKFLIENIIKG